MNQTTPLNSELLSADARGRKHIPVAVFAVIVIHVVLFLVLLIAAGCRSSARVNNATPQPAAAERNATPPPATRMANVQEVTSPLTAHRSVVATEPEIQADAEPALEPATREVTQKSELPRTAPAAKVAKSKALPNPKVYVVKTGDTLGEIARRHGTTIQAVRTANKMKNDTIRPGQKLQLARDARSAPLQVGSQQQKRSNEA